MVFMVVFWIMYLTCAREGGDVETLITHLIAAPASGTAQIHNEKAGIKL